MKKIPELRVKVMPNPRALFFKWSYYVQERLGSDVWITLSDGAGWQLWGFAITEERAFRAGRKLAAKYCEKIIKYNKREQSAIFEKVTCEDKQV